MNRWHKIARGALGMLAGSTFVGMQTAGYVDGAETTAGIDAGLIRDFIAAALTMASVAYPKLTRASVFYKSLTNQDALDEANNEIARLNKRIDGIDPAVKPKATRRKRAA